MTYKDIINRFRSITEDHLMLEDFGYGDLTDLKYVSQLGSDEERVSYPYLYLLPSASTRNGVVMNYAFNMIVMDMARPEDGPDTDKFDNYITIQSQCQQYIDDVLAQLYYFYKDQPEITLSGITYTPFKEKYQDVVAGMTATITIQVPTPLNECVAPFNNWQVEQTSLVTIGNRPYNSGATGSRAVAPAFTIPEAAALYKIEVDVDFKVLYDLAEATAPSPYNTPRLVILQDNDTPRFIREIEFNGELTAGTVQNIKETFEIELEDVAPDNNDLFFSWGYTTATQYEGTDVFPVENANAIEALAGTIKIYKLIP
tara:strand:- start:419 stop:1360 length:942 start_codon:yes stop_codon:yes gene_type:complete